ncbi:hypothetical protein VTN02DRAFT_4595 [Thermoascus thermophilus]
MPVEQEKKPSHPEPHSIEAGFADDAPTSPPPEIDPSLERNLLLKIDLRVIPALWLLFLVSFVDRGNLGNAKIEGLEDSLGMTGDDYNVALQVFTVSYVVLGIPANLVFQRYGPRVLSVMMFAWGLCTLGQGVTQSFAGLVTCRLLMGVCEAGFVPGCAYLIGAYYKKNEYLRRYSVFFSASMAAGAFNGLFANLLSRMDGVGGIFIVEALITVVISVASFFLIVPFPEHCTFLTPQEKKLLLDRLAEDGGSARDDRIEWRRVLETAMDWKIWLA